jgi:hypothetical protein
MGSVQGGLRKEMQEEASCSRLSWTIESSHQDLVAVFKSAEGSSTFVTGDLHHYRRQLECIGPLIPAEVRLKTYKYLLVNIHWRIDLQIPQNI